MGVSHKVWSWNKIIIVNKEIINIDININVFEEIENISFEANLVT